MKYKAVATVFLKILDYKKFHSFNSGIGLDAGKLATVQRVALRITSKTLWLTSQPV